MIRKSIYKYANLSGIDWFEFFFFSNNHVILIVFFLVIEDLPQSVPAQIHGLPHHDNRHEAVSKVLTTPDPMLVSQIVDAFATNPVDHM